jgi:hypothetical protein
MHFSTGIFIPYDDEEDLEITLFTSPKEPILLVTFKSYTIQISNYLIYHHKAKTQTPKRKLKTLLFH